MGFRLFRATGLVFAIRPKNGIATQGRWSGFHCYRSKGHWNNCCHSVQKAFVTYLLAYPTPLACWIEGTIH